MSSTVIFYRGIFLTQVCGEGVDNYDVSIWRDDAELFEVVKTRRSSPYLAKFWLVEDVGYLYDGRGYDVVDALDECIDKALEDHEKMGKIFRDLGLK